MSKQRNPRHPLLQGECRFLKTVPVRSRRARDRGGHTDAAWGRQDFGNDWPQASQITWGATSSTRTFLSHLGTQLRGQPEAADIRSGLERALRCPRRWHGTQNRGTRPRAQPFMQDAGIWFWILLGPCSSGKGAGVGGGSAVSGLCEPGKLTPPLSFCPPSAHGNHGPLPRMCAGDDWASEARPALPTFTGQRWGHWSLPGHQLLPFLLEHGAPSCVCTHKTAMTTRDTGPV